MDGQIARCGVTRSAPNSPVYCANKTHSVSGPLTPTSCVIKLFSEATQGSTPSAYTRRAGPTLNVILHYRHDARKSFPSSPAPGCRGCTTELWQRTYAAWGWPLVCSVPARASKKRTPCGVTTNMACGLDDATQPNCHFFVVHPAPGAGLSARLPCRDSVCWFCPAWTMDLLGEEPLFKWQRPRSHPQSALCLLLSSVSVNHAVSRWVSLTDRHCEFTGTASAPQMHRGKRRERLA